MNLDAAKRTLLSVLEQQTDVEDHTGFLGLDPEGFRRIVHLVEDLDPHWLAKQLRDTRHMLGLRTEIAGMMRGANANRLLLELLGG